MTLPTPIKRTVLACTVCMAVSQTAAAVTEEEFQALQEQLNLLADQVEQNSTGSNDATTIGGYGELHYNNWSDDQGNTFKELDFHRFVLMINHEFNDDIRFFSEFEIEHAYIEDTDDGSSTGYVAVEQAYVQFDLSEHTKANAGIFLVPVGILNETHEPATFYGVERNPVERNIIPTTWSEAGAFLSGYYGSGFSYDLALSSGLDGGTNIRGGRQKGSNAVANNLAATARVRYTGVPGLELAATAQYQDDMTQDTSDDIGSATLLEAHVRWGIKNLTLTGLYAYWDIDVAASASQSDIDKEKQDGGYIEASYKLHPEWGIFVRQNQWDNGGTGDTTKEQTNAGFNYWPHEYVVLKADYQIQNDVAGSYDGFNLGVGYSF